MGEKVTWKKEEAVAVVTINNPPANALSSQVGNELAECFSQIEEDESIRAVVLTGEGEKFFMAGADISGFPNMLGSDPGVVARDTIKGHRVFNYIDDFPRPVIAAVEGMALGGGCELMLACDLCIASENAQFGLPEINLGLFPGGGGTQRLPRRIGEAKAKELMFLGKHIEANKAYEIGLINHVVSGGSALEEGKKMAGQIAGRPAVAVNLIKQCVERGLAVPLEEGLQIEADLFERVFQTEDVKEGVNAFLEKRKASFQHR